MVTITLARGPGGDGDVAVTIEADGGVTADPLTIPAAGVQGTLALHIEPAFNQGETTLTVDCATPSALAQASLIVHVAGASGTLDTSFGSGGFLDLTPPTGNDVSRAMLAPERPPRRRDAHGARRRWGRIDDEGAPRDERRRRRRHVRHDVRPR